MRHAAHGLPETVLLGDFSAADNFQSCRYILPVKDTGTVSWPTLPVKWSPLDFFKLNTARHCTYVVRYNT